MVKFLNNDLEMQPFFFCCCCLVLFFFFSRLLSKLLIEHFSPLHLVCMNNSFFCFVLFISGHILYILEMVKKGIFPSIIKKMDPNQMNCSEYKIIRTENIQTHSHFIFIIIIFSMQKCRFSGYKTFTVDCCFFLESLKVFFLPVTIF